MKNTFPGRIILYLPFILGISYGSLLSQLPQTVNLDSLGSSGTYRQQLSDHLWNLQQAGSLASGWRVWTDQSASEMICQISVAGRGQALAKAQTLAAGFLEPS